MSRVSRLRKAVRDRTKRGAQLVRQWRKQRKARIWRGRRTHELARRKDPRAAESSRLYHHSLARERRLAKLVRGSRAKLASWRAKLAKAERVSGGAAAVKFLTSRAGSIEHNNRAPWLDRWARKYVGAWMVGQPWCGLACIVAWAHVGKKLPQGVVYTPNIVQWARSGSYFQQIPATAAKPGDLVVFNFPGGSSVADHVGLARGPARRGVIPTVEGNTSPGNGGSQANGGGIYLRNRPLGTVAIVARPK